MCNAPDIKAPPPPPAPPPVLEQVAPRSSDNGNEQSRRRNGLSRYKIGSATANPVLPRTNKIGGIPKKTGV